MKMRKTILIILVLCMLLPLGALAAYGTGGANTGNISSGVTGAAKASHYNVVFVVDASGSMKNTDKNNIRFDAIRLFLGLATEKGNYVGAVVFNHEILYSGKISEYTSMDMKKDLVDDISDVNPSLDTDIGGALLKAAEMLEANAAPNLPSVIVLLTDGNTEFSETEGKDTIADRMEASNDALNKSVAICQREGYQILGVLLNTDGKANKTELEGIVSQTVGGTVEEIDNAASLLDTFQTFYGMIYNERSEPMAVQDDGNGHKVAIFSVPSFGVEEVNILIEGDTSFKIIRVYKPDGTAYSDDDLADMTMESDQGMFKIIKIPDPSDGDWRIEITPQDSSNDDITINLVTNRNLELEGTLSPSPSASLRDRATVSLKLKENGVQVTGLSTGGSYKAMVHICLRGETGAVVHEEDFPMTLSGDIYSYEFELDDLGTYEVTPYLDESSYITYGQVLTTVVRNNPPAVDKDEVDIGAFAGVIFSIGKKIDLENYYSDHEDGNNLAYTFSSQDYEEDQIELDGSILRLKNRGFFSIKRITVTASDTQGESTDLTIKIHLISLDVIILGVILFLVLVALFGFKAVFGGGIYASISVIEQDNRRETAVSVDKYGKGPIKYRDLRWRGNGGSYLGKNAMIYKSGKNSYSLMPGKTVYKFTKKCGKFSSVDIPPNIDVKLYLEKGNDDGRVVVIRIIPN